MAKTLYLLDGMALAYRAHFALIRSPIFTSAGANTSALYGFTNTLIELLKNRQPTHLGVVFDTSAPTARHTQFPAYKAQRQEMPEDLAVAIPAIGRLCSAMNIPVLALDGYEADDIIGTLAKRAGGAEDFVTYMVTPDKDFAQLVTDRTLIYRPGTGGSPAEIWGVPEVCAKWEVSRPEQVIDVLALWGDTSDNIPGVPGFGEKTAKALIGRFGSVEELLKNTAELKGKQREKIEEHAEQARFSKWLATIITNVPVALELDDLAVRPFDEEKVKTLFVEFEFNSLGKRLFGEGFKAGRTAARAAEAAYASPLSPEQPASGVVMLSVELDLFSQAPPAPEVPAAPSLTTITDVPHWYQVAQSPEARAGLIGELLQQKAFCFDSETSSLDEKTAEVVGLSFSWKDHTGWFVPMPAGGAGAAVLNEFRPVFNSEGIEKIGHNLKFDLGVLGWHGIDVRGPFFDTMLAHALVEPDQRHAMDYLAEVYLGYSPVPITDLIGQRLKDAADLFAQLSMTDVMQTDLGKVAEYAAEDADVAWQLAARLRPLLKQKGLERVFYQIEGPLLPALVEMERIGVLLDVPALNSMSRELTKQITALEKEVHILGGGPFNLNSPKQLGEVLFDRLGLAEKPKKTRTGQYQTNEETLLGLATKHKIVDKILEHREATKLKGTYVDALPQAVFSGTGRVHTTYLQLLTATGRLSSNNPNLQNIPIRTPMGREIRRAFIAPKGHEIFCADYSQIELRIMAAISGDPAMREAFANGHDIHAATASRVYGVPMDQLLPEMRRTAKMVNFGIIYGISAFGLAQRLGIPREEARGIINGYFSQYPGVKAYMDRIIGEARTNGFVETLSGRRRYLRDINSGNATVRAAAERTAINTPIQGSAADMIKIAMAKIATALRERGLRTRMLLQVHDELVFEVPLTDKTAVEAVVVDLMKNAMPLEGVPIVVDTGWGKNWLEAH
ncbi:MAG: DNA polymerase I [Verrucomicrobiales bacterium]